ncbi:heme o synthase [Dactylosporangium sp. CA-139114]|uniref:heme o synthase n=1 Tax=Dactylosporangium sp. CA-139114 TaxID=3239931 RepID=UPI003D966FFF
MTQLVDHGVADQLTSAPVRPTTAGALALAQRQQEARRRSGLGAIVKAYVSLTKPRIVELLLITTVPVMFLADKGLPSLWLVLVVLVGGSLAAGAANALNCYIDRDIDQLMKRTSRRPLATHTVSPRSALIFGLTLAAVSTVLMATFTNLLATLLTVGAIAYYDLVYTMWLKRTTPQNTVWGGACGAAPVLIGWAAVTGGLSWTAWVLFAVVFLWQPPHFYALAIKFKDDYARAGIPMLPVVRSLRRVGLETVIYSWLTVGASVALWPMGMTPLYGVVAVVTGALLLVEAHRLHGRARREEPLKPMRLFHWSVTYLTLLFVAVAIDALIQ